MFEVSSNTGILMDDNLWNYQIYASSDRFQSKLQWQPDIPDDSVEGDGNVEVEVYHSCPFREDDFRIMELFWHIMKIIPLSITLRYRS